MRLGAAAALLLASACAGGAQEAQAAELDCQRRLAAAFGQGPAWPELAGRFEGVRDRLAALAPDGCSDDQRRSAERLVSLSGRIAATARAIGDLGAAMEQQPALGRDHRFLELQAMIEQFEHRRRRLVDDLRQMEMQAR